MSGSALVCGVIVTVIEPDGIDPAASSEALASGPVAVGIVAVFKLAVAPEKTAVAL